MRFSDLDPVYQEAYRKQLGDRAYEYAKRNNPVVRGETGTERSSRREYRESTYQRWAEQQGLIKETPISSLDPMQQLVAREQFGKTETIGQGKLEKVNKTIQENKSARYVRYSAERQGRELTQEEKKYISESEAIQREQMKSNLSYRASEKDRIRRQNELDSLTTKFNRGEIASGEYFTKAARLTGSPNLTEAQASVSGGAEQVAAVERQNEGFRQSAARINARIDEYNKKIEQQNTATTTEEIITEKTTEPPNFAIVPKKQYSELNRSGTSQPENTSQYFNNSKNEKYVNEYIPENKAQYYFQKEGETALKGKRLIDPVVGPAIVAGSFAVGAYQGGKGVVTLPYYAVVDPAGTLESVASMPEAIIGQVTYSSGGFNIIGASNVAGQLFGAGKVSGAAYKGYRYVVPLKEPKVSITSQSKTRTTAKSTQVEYLTRYQLQKSGETASGVSQYDVVRLTPEKLKEGQINKLGVSTSSVYTEFSAEVGDQSTKLYAFSDVAESNIKYSKPKAKVEEYNVRYTGTGDVYDANLNKVSSSAIAGDSKITIEQQPKGIAVLEGVGKVEESSFSQGKPTQRNLYQSNQLSLIKTGKPQKIVETSSNYPTEGGNVPKFELVESGSRFQLKQSESSSVSTPGLTKAATFSEIVDLKTTKTTYSIDKSPTEIKSVVASPGKPTTLELNKKVVSGKVLERVAGKQEEILNVKSKETQYLPKTQEEPYIQVTQTNEGFTITDRGIKVKQERSILIGEQRTAPPISKVKDTTPAPSPLVEKPGTPMEPGTKQVVFKDTITKTFSEPNLKTKVTIAEKQKIIAASASEKITPILEENIKKSDTIKNLVSESKIQTTEAESTTIKATSRGAVPVATSRPPQATANIGSLSPDFGDGTAPPETKFKEINLEREDKISGSETNFDFTTKPGVGVDFNFKAGTESKLGLSTRAEIGTRARSSLDSEIIPDFKTTTETRVNLKTEPQQGRQFKTISELRNVKAPKIKRTPPRVIFGSGPPSPPDKKYGFRGSNKKQIGGFPGFFVYVKRYGQFKKVNKQPLTEKEALALGAEKVETTLGATFKIRPSGTKATGSFSGVFNRQNFYSKSGMFIQRREKRLSTMGERLEIRSRKKIFG